MPIDPTQLPAVPDNGSGGTQVRPTQPPVSAVQRPMPPAGGQPVTATAVAQQRPMPPAGGQPAAANAAANQVAASRRTRGVLPSQGGIRRFLRTWQGMASLGFAVVIFVVVMVFVISAFFTPNKPKTPSMDQPQTQEIAEAAPQTAPESPVQQAPPPVVVVEAPPVMPGPEAAIDIASTPWLTSQHWNILFQIAVLFGMALVDIVQAIRNGRYKLWRIIVSVAGGILVIMFSIGSQWQLTQAMMPVDPTAQIYMSLVVIIFGLLVSYLATNDASRVGITLAILALGYYIPEVKPGILPSLLHVDVRSKIWTFDGLWALGSLHQWSLIKLSLAVYTLLLFGGVLTWIDIAKAKAIAPAVVAGGGTILLWFAPIIAPNWVMVLIILAIVVGGKILGKNHDWMDEGVAAAIIGSLFLTFLWP